MKIKSIEAFEVDLSRGRIDSTGEKKQTGSYKMKDREPASPMESYPAYHGKRSSWGPKWQSMACIATAEDGTFGIGLSNNSGPVVRIVNDHFASHIVGGDCMATEKAFDMLCRLATPYGAYGLSSFAISAVDLALWDLKGKLLERPVYELLGGPQKESIPCYATGYDLEWNIELGFRAVKLPMPFGPMDGLDGLKKTEELVAIARQRIGDKIELMLDCWMALDVEYTVRLAEILKPYRLKWIEDFLLPEDMEGCARVRERIPWQTLATGEHWYLPQTFYTAMRRGLVDVFQPDLLWSGGISACVHICHMARSAGVSVIPHGGMNWPYGQHLAYAMPAVPLGERSGGVSSPGVKLENGVAIPGTAVVRGGNLIPSDAPGFGIEVNKKWLDAISI